MFHESLEKQFNWNLMLRYTVKLTLNKYFMKYPERKISHCILPFKSIYFSYIHTYLNYANIAWASTQKTILKTINIKQEHAVRINFNEDRLCHSRPLSRDISIDTIKSRMKSNLMFVTL